MKHPPTPAARLTQAEVTETQSSPALTGAQYDRPDVKRGARLLLGETGVKAVAHSVYGYFATAFAVKLGASTFQMGLFSAFTEGAVAIFVLLGAGLVRPLGGRKRMVITTVLVSALPWVFMAALPLIPGSLRVWALIPLAGFSIALVYVSEPAWASWMADLVPAYRRGTYIGLSGSVLTLVTMTVGIGGAAVLDRLDGLVMWGFATVFLAAMVSRLVSAVILWRIVDPRPDLEIRTGHGALYHIKDLGHSKLGRYNLFILVVHVAFGLGAPFVGLYLLRDLGLSYLTFVGLTVGLSLTGVVCKPLWGQLIDRRGTMPVMIVSVLAASSFPLMFLVSTETWYLYIAFAVAGASTSGWGVAAFNYVLENSDEESRASSVGFFHAVGSAGMFGGALIGGAIASHLPTIFAQPLMTLFLLSAVLRLVSVAVLLPRVHEPNESRSLTAIARAILPRRTLGPYRHTIVEPARSTPVVSRMRVLG